MASNIEGIFVTGARPWHGIGYDADGNLTHTAEDGTVTILPRRICRNSLMAAIPRGRLIPSKRKRWQK